jgi:predicted DNA-binding transcriptional regulator AlpA
MSTSIVSPKLAAFAAQASRQLAAATAQTSHQLIDAKGVGRMLGCSWRHVLRLADEGVLPWGVKLGRLRRWDLTEIEQFIASGCRPVRQVGNSS